MQIRGDLGPGESAQVEAMLSAGPSLAGQRRGLEKPAWTLDNRHQVSPGGRAAAAVVVSRGQKAGTGPAWGMAGGTPLPHAVAHSCSGLALPPSPG